MATLANSQDLALIIRAQDQATSVLRGIGGSLGSLAQAASAPTKAVGGLVDGLGKIGLAGMGISALTQGLGGLASSLIGGNASMETYTSQLTTLMGSADAAKERIAQLAKIGADTPFELPQLVASEKILMGFGLTADKTMKLAGKDLDQFRTSIGDMAAGTGTDLAELTNLWGKFGSGATGEAISRLQELGIVTREQLTEVGIQFSKSGELISPLPEAMTAAMKIADSKFGGGMAKLSQTFEGQMSTLSDSFNQAKVAIMAPVFDVLKDGLTGVNALLSSDGFKDGLTTIASLMAGGVKTGVEAAKTAFQALEPMLVIAQDGFTGLSVIVQQAIAGDVVSALSNFGDFLRIMADRIGEQLGTWAQAFLAWIGPMVPPLLAQLVDLSGKIANWLYLTALPAIVENLASWAAAFVDWVAPKIGPLLGELGALLVKVTAWVLGTGAPELIKKLLEWGVAFTAWVAPRIPPLLAEMGKLLLALGGWILTSGIPMLAKWALDLGGEFVESIADGMAGALGGLKSWVTDNLANALPQWVRDVLGIHSPSSVFADIGSNMIRGLEVGIKRQWPDTQGLVQRLMGQFSGLGRNVSGDVGDWLNAALAITGTSRDWLAGLQKLVGLESSGDPRAVNPIEVLGQHASGLLQMLPSTFNAHKLDGFGDIWNPIDNAISAIRYIRDTYGSVYNIPGIGDGREFPGYATGGYVPDTGLAMLHAGEYVLNAATTRAMANGRSGGSAGGITWNGNVIVQGSVTTEHDLAETIRQELMKIGRRNGGVILG